MTADDRKPEPTQGTDEEGDSPLTEDSDTDDRAAWVHRKSDAADANSGPRPDTRDR